MANTIFLADPIGDAYDRSFSSDLTGLQIQETETAYNFRVDFQALYGGVNVNILLDLDGNRQTHSAYQLTEASIWSQVAILGIVETLYSQGSQTTRLSSWVSGNSLYIDMPKSVLPMGVDNLEVAVIANVDFASKGYDRLSDEGYLNLKTETIHIDNEGLNFSSLSWLDDPRGDQVSPVDLKGITLSLEGEHLVIRHYFHDDIDPYSISDVISGSIGLDLDGNILTGFSNFGEVYPTFGIDAEIDYYQYPWALGGEFDATLYYQPTPGAEIVKLNLGSPTTDSSYRTGTNWIEISVPLGLLPPITENAVILSDALAPFGGVDLAPDNSGIKLQDGTLIPFWQWRNPSYEITDPSNDSYGFGYDNDELTKVKGCRYGDGILLEIGYRDLAVSNKGTTVIDFDRTGDLIPDISLAFGWDLLGDAGYAFAAILIDSASGEIIQPAEPLVTLDFEQNQAYINVPYAALGSRNEINLMVRTIDSDYGLLYDQTGILTIPNSNAFVTT